MLGKSLRWVLYAEAGRADLGWTELVAITNALGPIEGRAFLDDAVELLYEEAGMGGLKKDLLGALQRRDFLGVLGTGAAVDLERLGKALQGMGVDAVVVGELRTITRWYASQSRVIGPGMLIPALQGHLRTYLDLSIQAPSSLNRDLNAGAAEVALLAAVLTFRLGHSGDALHYWLMASALGRESDHRIVQAYAVAARGTMLLLPSNWGGNGGNSKQALEQLGFMPGGLSLTRRLGMPKQQHKTSMPQKPS
jgi:hypothetical protein